MILVTGAIEDVWESKTNGKWNRGAYSIVSREGMIKMKQAGARPKDLIDLEYLRGSENAD